MSCTYKGASNDVVDTAVEQLNESGTWVPLAIDITSPGFLIFVYSVLSCQHMYMHTNAAERGLVLERADGALELVATKDWKLVDLHVRFHGKLTSGTPKGDDIEYIRGRMNQCPVSRNVHVTGAHDTQLELT